MEDHRAGVLSRVRGQEKVNAVQAVLLSDKCLANGLSAPDFSGRLAVAGLGNVGAADPRLGRTGAANKESGDKQVPDEGSYTPNRHGRDSPRRNNVWGPTDKVI